MCKIRKVTITKPGIKHGDGGVMLWWRCSSAPTGRLVRVDEMILCSKYRDFIIEILQPLFSYYFNSILV